MMTVLALVLLVLFVLACFVLIALQWHRRRLEAMLRASRAHRRARRRREDPLRIRQRVMVNLRNGSAVAGVMWRRYDTQLVLKDAVLHEQGQELKVDGDVVVDRAMVTFIQVLPVVAS